MVRAYFLATSESVCCKPGNPPGLFVFRKEKARWEMGQFERTLDIAATLFERFGRVAILVENLSRVNDTERQQPVEDDAGSHSQAS